MSNSKMEEGKSFNSSIDEERNTSVTGNAYGYIPQAHVSICNSVCIPDNSFVLILRAARIPKKPQVFTCKQCQNGTV